MLRETPGFSHGVLYVVRKKAKETAVIVLTQIEPRHILPMDKTIAVGFGSAYVSCDGDTIWQEDPRQDWITCWTVQMAEDAALKDPYHDWRIHLVGPLAEGHWQRQGVGEWVMYDKGEGFA